MNNIIYIILLKELFGSYLNGKISFIMGLNNIKNQKKFYCGKIELKEQIFIKSKSKKELSKIDLQKEIEKLDKRINLNLFLSNLEYLKKFKGFIVFFVCDASVARFVKFTGLNDVIQFLESIKDFK